MRRVLPGIQLANLVDAQGIRHGLGQAPAVGGMDEFVVDPQGDPEPAVANPEIHFTEPLCRCYRSTHGSEIRIDA